MEKVNAKLDEGWENAKEFSETETLQKRMAVRQKNQEQQQKFHKARYDAEIAQGERTPGGSHCQLKVCTSRLDYWIR